ncbi:HTH-type transcriptional regulator LutR [Gimesia panareensis]|uniref:HTH-type transcriptional regulator LutR n=1 Tax=Gimesia panareensis TaxID=2527978 RepID=A0A517QCV4_9PLAN|nr:FCD domain-containing protein [Gimesia panareensis]QDT29449.1 HTH-type transcriptional regulator LutR [Gimesia panareensis]
MPEPTDLLNSDSWATSFPKSSEIAEQICLRIQREKLVPGSYLGTVEKLTEEFGVSRSVIREAVGNLRGLGVITGRPKVGLSVAEGDIQSVLRKVLVPQTTCEKGWREVAQLRVVIEIGSLPMVTHNITEAQLDRLQQIIDEQSTLLANDQLSSGLLLQKFVEKDLLFHEALLQSANQELITQFHQVLMKYFQQGIDFFPLPTFQMIHEHQQVVDALRDRDCAAAVQSLTAHLKPIHSILNSLDETTESSSDESFD